MSDFRISLQHEDEEKIALYCAKNNIDFNQANAYDVTMDAFKDTPIIYKVYNKNTRCDDEHDVTHRVARLIECQNNIVERIADKVDLYKRKVNEEMWAKNIQNAGSAFCPNLDKLVDNLYKLNIVDGQSYLAFVCFLMQLVHSRMQEFQENDKTCVFFNGVPRNGKSATAKAICDIESQYGSVFKAQSGKILESTHEEQVWKSHLNYFDEVKPSDIDRELLLTIVNGGNVEINPKNKKPYNYNVNTNNIFTSNDQINQVQRRVSIIKFGNRLNGRPLAENTLREIISNIMEALPDFKYYYDLYQAVSIYNENRINPLAIESILTFFNSKFEGVSDDKKTSLYSSIIFNTHNIYNYIKGTYTKQIIPSERKDAIKNALKYFVDKKLITLVEYKDCTTKNYSVTGKNCLKIMEEYSKLNTKEEYNQKISKKALRKLLIPYFYPCNTDERIQKDITPDVLDQLFLDQKTISEEESVNGKVENFNPYEIDHNIQKIAGLSYRRFVDDLGVLIARLTNEDLYNPIDNIIENAIKTYVKDDMCKTISLDFLIKIFKTCIPDFKPKHEQQLKDRYRCICCLWENGKVDYSEERKVKNFNEMIPLTDLEYVSCYNPQKDGPLLIYTAGLAPSMDPIHHEMLEDNYLLMIKNHYEEQKAERKEKLKVLLRENVDTQELIECISSPNGDKCHNTVQ